MKKLLVLLAIFITFASMAQSVGINADGSTADPSAMLDISSTTKGFLPPRMTTTQRDVLTPTAAEGLVIFNTTTSTLEYNTATGWVSCKNNPDGTAAGQMQYWNGSNWVNIDSGSDGQVLKYTSNVPTWSTLNTYPDAPTIGTATAGDLQATIAFTPPVNNGGSAITSYTVFSNPQERVAIGTNSPITITGLTRGTNYNFKVTATNDTSTSLASSLSNSVLVLASPSAPTITNVSSGNGQVVVAFTAPSDNGGATITGYTATSSPGGITGSISQAGDGTITVSGLTNGTAYTFTVVASNSAGNSIASMPSVSATPFTVPNGPSSPVATAENAQASIAFTAPAFNGGSAISGYTVTSSPGSFTATGVSSPIVVTGLTNGTAYTFTVVATNAAGNSVASAASESVIPYTVPNAPSSLVTTAGNAQASIAFTTPTFNGGSVITGYTVTSSPGSFTSTGASSPIVVTGLTNGTSYTFTVVATNSAGNSTASTASASVTPYTVPGAPTSPMATAGNTQVSVAFTAPASNGGSTITGYTVSSSPGSFTSTGTSSPLVVTGLTNGTAYTFTVVATNAAGNSTASTESSAITPYTVPGAPTSPIANAGNAQASVAFTTPAFNGGSAITGYTVTSSPGSFTTTGVSSPLVVTGLTNGTAYTFTVVATNAAGNSVASSASVSSTPYTVPNAPTSPMATAGNAQVSIAFTAPASNGGSIITGYTVTSSPGNFTATGTSSPLIVTGLTNYTSYTFTVVATNIAGNSVTSTASTGVMPVSDVTNSSTGKTWMDRNLGASQVALSSSDESSYGYLYQWGRGTDGHQLRTSGTTSTLSSTDVPGHADFIIVSSGLIDWRSPQNTNLWQGVSGVNNPCPSGYRLPTEDEFNTEKATWSSQNAAGAFGSILKLPAAGYRNSSGGIAGVNSDGDYWMSTIGATSSRNILFNSTNIYVGSDKRAFGFSVRCIKN